MLFIFGSIVGIIAYIIVFPICEQLSSYVMQLFELKKGYIAYDIAVINHDIEKLDRDSQYQISNAIGFEIPADEECYDDDENVDENVYCSDNHKMGF